MSFILRLSGREIYTFPLEPLTVRSNPESLTERIVPLMHGAVPCSAISAWQMAPRYRSARLWQKQRPDDGHILMLNKTALMLAWLGEKTRDG
jgi:hypothetical protein